MNKKRTRLLGLYKSPIPSIENYPLPKIAKSRRVASIIYRTEPLSSQVLLSGAHVYRKEDYHAYRDAISWLIKERLGGEWDTHRYSFGVRARFFLGNRRKIDIDNLLKPIMDAGTHLIWADDSQVVEIYAIVLREEPDPRLEALFYTVEDFIDYHRYCAYCGKELTGWTLTRKYCSRLCHDNAQRKGTERKCEFCGKPFWDGRLPGQRKRARRFCSRVCYGAWVKEHGREQVERFKKRVGNQYALEIGEVQNEQ